MDPLSVIGSFIAALLTGDTIISHCYDYRKYARSAPRDVARILDDVSNLRNTMEFLTKLLDEDVIYRRGYLLALERLTVKDGPLERCQFEMDSMESRLEKPLSEWKALGKQLIWPLEETETLKYLETITRTKSLVEAAVTNDNSASVIVIRENMRDLRERALDFQRHMVLSQDTQVYVMLDWLGAADQSSRFKFETEKRHNETGSWLLAQDVYKSWKSGPSSLWLHGIPGCGKTILCSTIIEDVLRSRAHDNDAAVAYYFFDFGNKLQGTLDAMLRSFLSQLLIQAQSIPERLGSLARDHFSTTRYGTRPGKKPAPGPTPSSVSQPSTSELVSALQGAVEEFDNTCLIIDAIDECVELDQLLEFLEKIITRNSNSLRILVTCQSRKDIGEVLLPIVTSQLLIESAFLSEDMALFIQSTLEGDQKLRKWPQKIKDEIQTILIEGSQGMFQWITLQLQVLRECLTLRDIEKALSSLPKTLDATYNRILENMDDDNRKHAITILKLLALSHHPVQVQEANEFIAFNFDVTDGPHFDSELRLPDVQHILAITSGLASMNTIMMTREDGSIKDIFRELRLTHFSVKEFLVSYSLAPSPRTLLGPTALEDWNALLLQCCLVYLDQLPSTFAYKDLLQFPAARYVAQNWIFYAQASPSEYRPVIEELASHLLYFSTATYHNWIRLYDHDVPWREINVNSQNFPSPLYYAAVAGLGGTVQRLLEAGENPDGPGGFFGSSLEAAVRYEHIDIARMLIAAGADPNTSEGFFKGSLMTATVNDREDMVKLIIDSGANVNARGLSYDNPLLEACIHGHTGIVRLLLEAGASPDAYNEKAGGNPIETATRQNHPDIVALLLPKSQKQTILGGLHAVEKSNAVGMMDLYSKFVPDSVMFYAAEMGLEDLVTDLLSHGASNISSANRGYMRHMAQLSALVSAATNGHETIVRQLLKTGADVNLGSESNSGLEFALGGAAEAGYFEIVKILIENGADVRAISSRGDALQRAAYCGDISIVKLLLDHGADINQPTGLFGGALQGAVLGRHLEIIKMLLEKGADINLRKLDTGFSTSSIKSGATSLEAAVNLNDTEMVQYLLANGAETASSDTGTSLLATAAATGNEVLLRTLLDAGADIEQNKEGGLPPLYRAITAEQLGSMKLLIDAGADVKTPHCLNGYIYQLQPGRSVTPLSAAVSRGFEDGVRLLLEHHVDIQDRSKNSMQMPESPLHTAARHRNSSMARVLLEHGANVNEQIEEGWTPLHFAARSQSHDVVRVLVEEFKADTSLTLQNGSQAIHSAANFRDVSGAAGSIISTLIDAGADINVCNDDHRTPLHFAAETGNLSAAQVLLEREARLDGREENNMTALDIAKVKFAAEPNYSAQRDTRKQILEILERRV